MSDNLQPTENIQLNCIHCHYLKESMQKFSCSHLICNECLCLLLINQKFNFTNITSNITFSCPECLQNFDSKEQCSNLILSYTELKDIFQNSINTPLKCNKHPKKELKYFCEKCQNELCEDCKKDDLEHNNFYIQLEDIKANEAKKIIKNQFLTLDEIKNKIEANKMKIS